MQHLLAAKGLLVSGGFAATNVLPGLVCDKYHATSIAWIWRPILPPLQIAVLAAILIALSTWSYWRVFPLNRWVCPFLWLMRVVAIAVLTIVLCGPSELPPTRSDDAQRVDLAIVLDVSDSMMTKDCQGATRLETARKHWLNLRQVRNLNERCNLQFYRLGEDLEALDWQTAMSDSLLRDTDDVTFLTRNAMKAIRSQGRRRDGAILLLSDGHDTEEALPEPAGELAAARGIPLHTVCFGTTQQQQDLVLFAVPMQDYLMPDEPGAILIRAYQSGMPDCQTTLRLRQGDHEQTVPLEFRGRPMVELQLPIQQAEEGQYEYQISLDQVADEAEAQNNRQTLFCQVQERRMRVLVLEGEPYWDTKFLAQSLRKDERIELTQITQVSPDNRETLVSRSEGNAVQIPTTQEEWAAYDVVILGRHLQNLLDGALAAQLQKFVADGGGHVVFARGPCYDLDASGGAEVGQALRPLEPVVWSDTELSVERLEVEPRALDSSWFAPEKLELPTLEVFRQLPALGSLHRARRVKPATQTLLTAREKESQASHPALVTMPAGAGRVVAFLSDESWRWSLRPPDAAGGSFYDAFWSNLVRWLIMGGDFQPGRQASLKLSRQSLRLGDELVAEVVFRNPTAAERPWSVVWESAAGESFPLQLRRIPGKTPRFRTTFAPSSPGIHTIRLTVPGDDHDQWEQKINVYQMNVERLEPSARPGYLRRLAELSGGETLPLDQPQLLLAAIQRRLDARRVPPEPRYVWDHWPVLLGLVGWMGVEWIVRRTAGLL